MTTAWSVAKMPGFVARDSELMIAQLIAYQVRAIQRGAVNELAYADVYARVFGTLEPLEWVYQPPATVARGIATMIREVGLFVLLDDDVALDVLYSQTTWRTVLPPVRIARVVNGTPVYTPARQRQLANRAAFEALVHRAALLAYAERLPLVRITSLRRARDLQVTITAMFDVVIDEASRRNDGTSRMLRQIATTTGQLLDARTGPLEDDGLLRLAGVMPSLVVAHLAYREARQVRRIRETNPTAHPNFMPPQVVVPPWP